MSLLLFSLFFTFVASRPRVAWGGGVANGDDRSPYLSFIFLRSLLAEVCVYLARPSARNRIFSPHVILALKALLSYFDRLAAFVV